MMDGKASAHVTTAARYDVIQEYGVFEDAVKAVVQRVQVEGLKSVLTYQFFGNPQSATAGAVITYADAHAWMKHHEIIPGWEELKAFQATVKSTDYALYGALSPEIMALLNNAKVPHNRAGDHVAGFVRRGSAERGGAAGPGLITVTEYALTKPREAYEAAIQALARRTENEGHQDLLTYQFYLDPDSSKAGGVIAYADGNAFVEHHQRVAPWEEYAVFKGTHELVDIKVYGTLDGGAKGFLQQANLLDKHVGAQVAGFVRD